MTRARAVAIPLATMAVVSVLVAWRSLALTGGEPGLALDDGYIHLAIAANLVESGTWGINPGEFAAAGSSLVWPLLLLPGVAVVGPNPLLALLLNALVAVLMVWRAARALGPDASPAALLCLVALLPLTSVAATGMEHLLHAWLSIELLMAIVATINGTAPRRLWLLAILLPLVRLEALAQLAVAAVVLTPRHPRYGRRLIALVGLPVAGWAVWNLAHDWPGLPTGVLLRSRIDLASPVASVANNLAANLATAWPIAVMGAAALAATALPERRAGQRAGLWLTGLWPLAHLTFGSAGHLFRYDAFLVAPLVVTLTPVAIRIRSRLREPGIAAAVAIVTLGLLQRGLAGIAIVPAAVRDVHHQQVQMARFLSEHYAGATVMLNDIGAPAASRSNRIIDATGLASLEIAQARLESPDAARAAVIAAAADCEIAILYDDVIGTPPADWRWLGSWTTPDPTVLGQPTVHFFAISPGSDAGLGYALEAFDLSLPAAVARDYAADGARPPFVQW